MNFNKKVIFASLTLATLGTVLTGCVPEGLKPLPDEQRYSRIDKVLNDIDYKNVGEIVREEKDDAQSVTTPAYKAFYYEKEKSFYSLAKNLSEASEDCYISEGIENLSEEVDSLSCLHFGLRVSLVKYKDKEYEAYIKVTDKSGGM